MYVNNMMRGWQTFGDEKGRTRVLDRVLQRAPNMPLAAELPVRREKGRNFAGFFPGSPTGISMVIN